MIAGWSDPRPIVRVHVRFQSYFGRIDRERSGRRIILPGRTPFELLIGLERAVIEYEDPFTDLSDLREEDFDSELDERASG